jgi:hypothetical protein
MANWLRFDKIEIWDFAFIAGFQYDKITDRLIAEALADEENVAQVDTSLDWEDDDWLRDLESVPDTRKHAYRVAALVRDFQSGAVMCDAISMDTFTVSKCASCVTNGHHRVRALQYLGVPAAPFSLSGSLDVLKDLVQLANVEGAGDFAHYFSPSLAFSKQEDVSLCVVKSKSEYILTNSPTPSD